jgi:hypothetical protein
MARLGIKHLSPTSLGQWEKCPLSLLLKILHGGFTQTGRTLAGSAGHAALEKNFRHKLKTGKDLGIVEFLGGFEDAFCFGRGVVEDWQEHSPGEWKDMLVNALDYFYRYHVEDYTPLLVEHGIEFEIPAEQEGEEPATVVGYIDFYGKNEVDLPVIMDWKFSGRRKREARGSKQLRTYGLALEAEGKHVAEVGEGRLVWGERTPYYISDTVETTGNDYLDLRQQYRSIWNKIQELGDDPEKYPHAQPANNRHWWCSRKWCGWWNHCPIAQKRGFNHAKKEQYPQTTQQADAESLGESL